MNKKSKLLGSYFIILAVETLCTSASFGATEPINLTIPLVSTYATHTPYNYQVERYEQSNYLPQVNYRYTQEYGRRGGFTGVYQSPMNYNYIP